jgi:hypothetical protein
MRELPNGLQRTSGLVDVLDRVLDKGLVVAGDIKISLAEVELLTIRIRLLVCSIDKAEQIGLDWWRYDHHLSPGKNGAALENDALRRQVVELERRLAELTGKGSRAPALPPPSGRTPTSRVPNARGSAATRAPRSRRKTDAR